MLLVFVLFYSPMLMASQFDGVWTGNAVDISGGEGCNDTTPVVVLIDGGQIKGTVFDEDDIFVTGTVNSDGMISSGSFTDMMYDIGSFTGTFSGETATISYMEDMVGNCSGTLMLTQEASFDSGFDELWTGTAEVTQGVDCENATITFALTLDQMTGGPSTFKGSMETASGFVVYGESNVSTDTGLMSEGRIGTRDNTFGSLSGQIQTDPGGGLGTSGSGNWTFEGCSGTFEITRSSVSDGDNQDALNFLILLPGLTEED
jgi:hypothetical protein